MAIKFHYNNLTLPDLDVYIWGGKPNSLYEQMKIERIIRPAVKCC